jgi:Raf kinase inhibitor-like YbhB/YbcL family protein
VDIPRKYTCDGEDVSPPLHWENIPVVTKAFAIIFDDPDAPGGTWVYWVIYDLAAETTDLPESVPKTEVLATGGKQGRNDFVKSVTAAPVRHPVPHIGTFSSSMCSMLQPISNPERPNNNSSMP